MTNKSETELESHGVEVWLCGTIYVEAVSEEDAEKIVAERYTGTRETPDELMIGVDDIRIWHNQSIHADRLAPTTSLYGIASESKLVPEADPVRDAASDMLAALQQAEHWLQAEADSPEPGATKPDEILWVIREVIAKAEGGAAPAQHETAQSLEAKYGRWTDHPDWSDRNWRDDETRLGYWEWVASKLNEAEGGAA